jgi:nitroreductase
MKREGIKEWPMELHSVITTRHSIKDGFGPTEDIPRQHLERIVDAGRLAPTGSNRQPWEFIVVTKPELLARLRSLKPNTSAAIVLAYDPRKRLSDGRTYHREDLAAAAENMLLTITDLGYGGCWVQGGLDTENTEEVLQIPEPYKAFIMICIGALPAKIETREKRSLADVLHWEKF